MKIKKICDTCGSEDVVVDAWAEWDIETQQWVLHEAFDAAFCRSCEGECNINEEPVP